MSSTGLTSNQRWVLLALEPEPSHGYAIIKRVETLSHGKTKLATGTLYPALEGLLNDGLIQRTDRVDSEAPDRVYYEITDAGWAVVS